MRKALLGRFGAAAVLGLFFAFLSLLPATAPPASAQQTVRMPNLVGMNGLKAVQLLKSLGLTYAYSNQATTNPKLHATIARQSPAPGAMLPAGSKVTLVQYWNSAPPPATVVVPNLVGQDYIKAMDQLARGGLRYSRTKYPTADRNRSNKVFRQSPAPGQRVPRNTVVMLHYYTLSMQAAVVVPSVQGLPYRDGLKALSQRYLKVKLDPARVPTAEQRMHQRIARQSPAAGTKSQGGQTVTLWLYHYTPARAVVPNVVNMPPQQAVEALRKAGLSVTTAAQRVPTSDRGKVNWIARQSPAAGQRTNRGTRVTVWVYSYAPVVPNVVNMPPSQATEALRKAGLSVVTAAQRVPTGDRGKVNWIARQSPAAGQRANQGARVTVWVYSYAPPEVVVPNLVNLTLAQAGEALRKAGLTARLEQQRITAGDRSKVDRVARQNPGAGQRVRRGFLVTLWLFN
ncbi:MAG: PASTA domain-containing protein [Desulfarculus sp.]|nr:MAG: PASTA domain-containing protein [Desulfarculus sp.]